MSSLVNESTLPEISGVLAGAPFVIVEICFDDKLRQHIVVTGPIGIVFDEETEGLARGEAGDLYNKIIDMLEQTGFRGPNSVEPTRRCGSATAFSRS